MFASSVLVEDKVVVVFFPFFYLYFFVSRHITSATPALTESTSVSESFFARAVASALFLSIAFLSEATFFWCSWSKPLNITNAKPQQSGRRKEKGR